MMQQPKPGEPDWYGVYVSLGRFLGRGVKGRGGWTYHERRGAGGWGLGPRWWWRR